MLKRMLMVLFMITAVVVYGLQPISAYSADYLPGGVNYLSEDNFEVSSGWYKSSLPFLVKPYTYYTLAVPSDYMEVTSRIINFYCFHNDEYLNDFGIHIGDMTYYDDGAEDWYTYTFMTTYDMNYLDIYFENQDGYFSVYGFYGFQLEEGTVFSGYETYVAGDIMDTSAPYFLNYGTVISYFDSPITISEIQSALIAYDDIDGDLTGNITLVSDNYTSNVGVLGTYDIVFQVSDLSGNASQITIWVDVVDVLKPIFSDIGIIQAVYPNVYDTASIIAMLSASDNYDGDVSASIQLVSDGYTGNANVVGIYQMEFSVTDSSGNVGYHTQSIQVVDETGPIISGITTIMVGYNTPITQELVMSNLSCTDNYDLSSELVLVLESDDYSAYSSQLGNYAMVFSVTDSSGNKTYQTVVIQVVDELGPVVYFDASIIQTYTNTVLALPDFTQLLISSEEIDGSVNYDVVVVYDSYTRNAATPGTYHLTLKYTAEDGSVFEKTLEIRVTDKAPDYIYIGDSETEENETALSQFGQYYIAGAVALVLVVSNIVWVVVLKKK